MYQPSTVPFSIRNSADRLAEGPVCRRATRIGVLAVSNATICAAVRRLTEELARIVPPPNPPDRGRRGGHCHLRQTAMYVCHVALRLPQADIAEGFGRDRTTVGHACHVVEDRRDDPAFDLFVGTLERFVRAAFIRQEEPHD